MCCLLLGACADVPTEGTERYVVLPQDTLYSIAWRHDLDFRDLARWNNLGPDFRISVGQVLLLRPGLKPKPTSPPPRIRSSSLPWAWPTDRIGAPRAASGGGVILSGRLGQDVRAASAGRVVYIGSGLRGYGNLIIIKHADSWLSAYGHNRDILVHEGQDVALGQVIAHMGEDAHQAAILYFGIRQNGRPVDPLACLSNIK